MLSRDFNWTHPYSLFKQDRKILDFQSKLFLFTGAIYDLMIYCAKQRMCGAHFHPIKPESRPFPQLLITGPQPFPPPPPRPAPAPTIYDHTTSLSGRRTSLYYATWCGNTAQTAKATLSSKTNSADPFQIFQNWQRVDLILIPRTDRVNDYYSVKVFKPFAHHKMVSIFCGGIYGEEREGEEGWYETTQIVPNDGVSSPRGLAVAPHTHLLWLHIAKSTQCFLWKWFTRLRLWGDWEAQPAHSRLHTANTKPLSEQSELFHPLSLNLSNCHQFQAKLLGLSSVMNICLSAWSQWSAGGFCFSSPQCWVREYRPVQFSLYL